MRLQVGMTGSTTATIGWLVGWLVSWFHLHPTVRGFSGKATHARNDKRFPLPRTSTGKYETDGIGHPTSAP
ncbi:uncharacterized protein IWZ02DRAFT_438207 [Phyllosticta citriasiana]|uniref:uncharacterized protein n=1 Tax=Phyllosticta citriasiana TaxID=595635 RepID=UPI0030FD7DD6